MATAPKAALDSAKRSSWRRRAIRLLAGAACCYLGVIVVLVLLENWLLYHPLKAREVWLAPPNPRVQDIELRTSAGIRIHGWWCPVEKWEPEQGALLYCHGNAGNLSCRADAIARWQNELGKSVLIFDYPGFGRSEGKPSEAGCYAAADAAYAWLTEVQKVPPEQLLIYGGSLGGGVAVDLASRMPHGALILVKTFLSIPDVAQRLYPWLPARWLVRNRFDSQSKIGLCRQPVLVAHGTADSLIPFAQGRRLFEAANEPKCFVAMEGVDHNDFVSSEFFQALRKFLEETSRNAGQRASVAVHP
ncbi:MAG TPA: alpha/beta hydrolase [Gemmataceae bacterium]|nr:alpha/beta hydrolase [Gemmataceae bacterium]